MTGGSTQPVERPVVRGRGEPYRADELVVTLPYARLVARQLGDWGATPREEDDERLGLALLTLRAASARAYLERHRPDEIAAARAAADRDGQEPSDLDLTLRVLRSQLRRDYSGWVPTMGKNRMVSRLSGAYVIDGGGAGGRPRPVEASYVIDGGGVGGRPRRVGAAYVIDGGGQGQPAGLPAGAPLMVARRGTVPGRGARVGLVDTRLATHPWLAGGYIAAADALLPPDPDLSLPWMADHATFVAGLVLRQAPGAVIELRSGLDDDGSQDSWSLAQSVADLADSSADVVNLSLGCRTEDGAPPLVLSAALAALGPRTVVVAAAGNYTREGESGRPAPSWPAALDHVVAVGAVDGSTDGIKAAPFSPDAPWVDALAPGVDVVSTCDAVGDGTGVFARWSGTSFAAAAVTGAIAGRVGPGRTARQAWEQLRDEGPHDQDGRPVVPLGAPTGWPPDGPDPKAAR